MNDPIAYAGGTSNTYQYLSNSPVILLDSHGLSPTTVIIENTLTNPSIISDSWGAIFWPVKFTLNEPSDPFCGGWVIQHVIWKTYVSNLGIDGNIMKKPSIDITVDYWEAWRVDANEIGPYLSAVTEKSLVDILNRVFHIEHADKKPGNDFYITGPHPRTEGYHDFKGEVYYIDGMKEDELPGTWDKKHTDKKPAGGLPSIETAGNQNAIDQLLKRKGTIGPFQHNIHVDWKFNNQGTNTYSKKIPK